MTLAEVFSCEFCKISKNTLFTELRSCYRKTPNSLGVTVYFHLWFYEIFLQKQPFTNDFQSSCSETFTKNNRKRLVMEFFISEVRVCNFTIKGLRQRFFPVNFDKFFILFIKYLRANGFVPLWFLWDFTSILKAVKALFLLQLPCRSNNDLTH